MKNKLKPIHEAVEVWNLLLPDLKDEVAPCRMLLTEEEKEQAAKFIKPPDAERFILSRGLQRKILARYLDTPPDAIQFSRNENGKPFLDGSPLQFNVSHSHNRLLIAVTAGRAIGVDIEFRRNNIAMDSIAERWFSPAERRFFQGLENPQPAFFDIWSKKEAYVKALGLGVFHELNSFTIPLDGEMNLPTIGKMDNWFFQTLEIDPAYAAAIVFEAPAVPVNLRNLTT